MTKHPIPDEALDDRLGIVGTAGSGKTYAAGTAVERILDRGGRVVIPDPLGVWYGLRLLANGKPSPHKVVIFGGPHGDLPINEHAGALIGEAVAGMAESAIVDLSGFGTKASERRFMLAFLTAFYRKASGEPVHLIFDEADMWCLDEKTEILTSEGWRKHDGIAAGDIAVCFDLGSETYSYGKIERVIEKRYSGPMVRLKTKALDCLATPDHRVVLRRVQRAAGRYGLYPWTFCEASKVPTCVGIPSGGAPVGAGVDGLTTDLARIMGWVITDGNIHNRRAKTRIICIEQAATTVKQGVSIFDQMTEVLSHWPSVRRYERKPRNVKSGGRTRKHAAARQWYLGADLSRRLLRWLGDDVHRIPREILRDGNPTQLRALYQGMMEGDGSSQGGKRWTHFYPGVEEGLADDFQELALRLGISTSKLPVSNRNDICISISSDREGIHWLRKSRREQYDGIVWDVTVPTGAFVARRNGRIFVTGNCPQHLLDKEGEAAKLLGMMETVVRRGRIKGFIPWTITQRPAVISKNVLSQADGLVAMKLTSSQDRKALGAWVEGQADVDQWKGINASLAALDRGQGVLWLPARGILETVRFPAKRTFDSSRTPKRGETVTAATLAPLDLGALKERLAAVEAETKANDPKALRARIAELTRELASKKGEKINTVDPKAIEAARQEGFDAGFAKGNLFGINAAAMKAMRLIDDLSELAVKAGTEATRPKPPHQWKPTADVAQRPEHRAPVVAGSTPAVRSEGISGSQQRILDSLAWLEAIGIERAGKVQLALLAEASPTSSTFSNNLGALRTGGYIDYPVPGFAMLTSDGRDKANQPDAPPTTADLHARVRARVSSSQWRILYALISAYPNAYTKGDLAAAVEASATSSTFSNNLGALRTLGLIDYPQPGQVVALPVLFVEGR